MYLLYIYIYTYMCVCFCKYINKIIGYTVIFILFSVFFSELEDSLIAEVEASIFSNWRNFWLIISKLIYFLRSCISFQNDLVLITEQKLVGCVWAYRIKIMSSLIQNISKLPFWLACLQMFRFLADFRLLGTIFVSRPEP